LGCPGARQFIEASIHPLSDTQWFVADAKSIRGICEMRRLQEAIVINQIAVEPESQGSGVARRLLAYALDATAGAGTREVLLDVFSHVTKARDWYTRLGFQETLRTTWALFDLQAVERKGSSFDVVLKGVPQSIAVHQAFGFSEIILASRDREYRVGRLSADRYRSLGAEILEDVAAVQALVEFEPSRRWVLVQAPKGQWLEKPGMTTLWESIRMKTPWPEVSRKLKL
jgi:N-acetylglutamate synthase-like GNAT family acetyltransferase